VAEAHVQDLSTNGPTVSAELRFSLFVFKRAFDFSGFLSGFLVSLQCSQMASCTAKSWSDAKPDVWKSCCVEDGPSLRESEVVCVETKPKQLTQSWGSAAYNARALELVATKATSECIIVC
jgi:hypothetical protein